MFSIIGVIALGIVIVYGYYHHKKNDSAIVIDENARCLGKRFISDCFNVSRMLAYRVKEKFKSNSTK